MSFIMRVAQKAKSLGHRNASARGGRGTGPATGNTQPHISLQTDVKSRSLDSLQTEELSREPAVMLRELQSELQGQGGCWACWPTTRVRDSAVELWGGFKLLFAKESSSLRLLQKITPGFSFRDAPQSPLLRLSAHLVSHLQREHSSKRQILEEFNVPDFWEFTSHHM